MLTLCLGGAVAPVEGEEGDPGPFHDEVYGAASRDGVRFAELPGPLFQHASVPDVVELTQESASGARGTLLLYFVDFGRFRGPGSEGLSVASSVDGRTWSEPEPIVIAKKANRGGAVDPSVVQLEDGRTFDFAQCARPERSRRTGGCGCTFSDPR